MSPNCCAAEISGPSHSSSVPMTPLKAPVAYSVVTAWGVLGTGWLVGWLVGWLGGWLVGWLVNRPKMVFSPENLKKLINIYRKYIKENPNRKSIAWTPLESSLS